MNFYFPVSPALISFAFFRCRLKLLRRYLCKFLLVSIKSTERKRCLSVVSAKLKCPIFEWYLNFIEHERKEHFLCSNCFKDKKRLGNLWKRHWRRGEKLATRLPADIFYIYLYSDKLENLNLNEVWNLNFMKNRRNSTILLNRLPVYDVWRVFMSFTSDDFYIYEKRKLEGKCYEKLPIKT